MKVGARLFNSAWLLLSCSAATHYLGLGFVPGAFIGNAVLSWYWLKRWSE